jgi:cysteine desulfurase
MQSIYLDNNATTPLLPAVLEAMLPYFSDKSGNPASSHHQGRFARQAMEDARERSAHLLECHPDEIIFTSGATEANNLALFGLAGDGSGLLVSSGLEHPCVSEPLQRLVEKGFRLVLLPVTAPGVVSLEESVLPTEARLVSVMLANHETGAVQPIEEITQRLGGQVPFHCDAAAAVGKMPVSFRRLGVDALTISAHKFHGPKGIGALLLKRGRKLQPQLWGGHQQQGKRPGTEPVPLIVGFARALELAVQHLAQNRAHLLQMRQLFLSLLRAEAAPVVLNGPEEGGLPSTLNLSFPGCRGDGLLMALDLAGVACSTGSACSSGSLLPSPVLRAMGLPAELLQSALRFSLSHLNTAEEVTEAAGRIGKIVRKLRENVE